MDAFSPSLLDGLKAIYFKHGLFSVRGVGLKLGCGHHGLYVGLHLADGFDIKIFDQYLDHGR